MSTATAMNIRSSFNRKAMSLGLALAACLVMTLGARAQMIGDYVWHDVNTNGLQDAAEPGFSNILVNLYDANSNAVVSAVTDGNGYYAFTNIANGTYFIGFVPPLGYEFTRQDAGVDDNIDSDASTNNGTTASFVYSGTSITNIDAGLIQLEPGISLTKLAGPMHTDPYFVTGGTFVTYTYIVTNTGNTYLHNLFIFDDALGEFIVQLPSPECLAPGTTTNYTTNVQIFASITNVATAFATPSNFKCIDYPTLPPAIAEDTGIVIVVTPGYTIAKSQTLPANRPAALGEPVIFTVTLVNTGDVELTTVPLVDTYDTTILSYVASTPPSDDNVDDGTINWANVGPLAAGSSTDILVGFTAVASTLPGQSTNRVVSTPSTTNGIPVPPHTNEVPFTTEDPGFQIVKSLVSPTGRPAAVGEQVVFAIAITNSGDVALDLVPVVDTYSTALLTYNNATPASDDNNNDGTINWANVGPLAAGGSIVITARFTAASAGTGTNVVIADPVTTNEVPVPPRTSSVPHSAENPDLDIFKRVISPVGRPAVIGEQVQFSITVTNVGNVPVFVVPLDDIYNTNLLSYVGATPPSDDNNNDGLIHWTDLGTLNAGGSITVTTLFTAVTNGIGTNIVIVPTTTNEIPHTNVNPVVQITKSLVSPTGRPAGVGETVVFAIAVVNAGDVTLDTVPVMDTYSTNLLAYQSATPASDDNIDDGVLNWANVGPLLQGQGVVITTRFTAVAAGMGTNIVITTPTTTNGIPVPPRTNEVPHDASNATLVVTKVLISEKGGSITNFADVGDELDFAITVTNVGIVPAIVVPLVDIYQSNLLSFISASPVQDFHISNVLTWTNLGPLNIASAVTVTTRFTAIAIGIGSNFVITTGSTNYVPHITPVELRSFRAERNGDGVDVTWDTASEVNNLGFNVYRSAGAGGEKVKLNGGLIAGLGTSANGQHYAYADAQADKATTWYYWLEDVSVELVAKLHGPAIVSSEEDASADALVGSFDVDARTGGVFRITWETLSQAGVGANALQPDQVKVLVNGREVASYVSSFSTTLRQGDFILFYVPSADGAVSCEVRSGPNALRMGEVYAAPDDESTDVWYGSAQDGMLLFDVTDAWHRYLLGGFASGNVLVLDVTDASMPQLLFGYSWLYVSDEAGVYLGYAPGATAHCIAVDASSVRDVTGVQLP